MSKKKQVFLVALCLIIVIGFAIAYSFLRADTSIQVSPTELSQSELSGSETGDEKVLAISDYRTFPVREATTTIVTGNLDAPWAFTWLPNGDMLVTERFGSLRRIQNGTLLDTPIDGVPDVFSSGQGGLLDITVHPEFNKNQFVYISYAHGSEEGNRLRIARGVLTEFSLRDIEVIFEVAQTKVGSSHYGSRFQWLPDGTLLFTVGDGGNPPIQYNGELIREQAQYLSSHLGKIIRINDDGTIPADNPFIGRPDVRQEIFSYGHRNPQGITFDVERNQIIASEHGSKGGDELNLIQAGENYGWPLVTFSTEYDISGTRISPDLSLPSMEDPLIVWTPTVAPSQVVSYSGEQYSNARGNLFMAAMLLREDNSFAAYASSPAGAVFHLIRDTEGIITSQELIALGEVRIRSIEQGPDGYLYILTDSTARQNRPGSNAGELVRLEAF